MLVYTSIGIFTFNYTWAAKLTDEASEATRTMLMTNMSGFFDLAGGLMFIGTVSFAIGSLLFGIATWKGTGLEKALSAFLFLVVIVEILSVIGHYGNQAWLASALMIVSPIVWVVVFFVSAAWFWKSETARSF